MVTVLRLGERAERDYRVNTHLALVARAFGADRLVMSFSDPSVDAALTGVNQRFGGTCTVERIDAWARFIREWNGISVHLTMYGETLDRTMEALGEKVQTDDTTGACDPDILIIVGSEKVQRKVYELADFNTSVGNQPHSEIAALSVFLDRLFKGRQFHRDFEGEWNIIPDPRGKTVERLDAQRS